MAMAEVETSPAVRGSERWLVSGDRQQLAAAEAEGLATDNPFDHLS